MRIGKRGFTLVELSIVLVIIGLLIGGILVGQSMMSSSKIVAVAAQIQQFDAGVESFKAKYNYLPGDAPAFGGDGDGMIDITAAGLGYSNGVFCFHCEIANFWNNINPAQYASSLCVQNSPVGYPVITAGTNKNVPLSKLGSNGSFFIASALANAPGGAVNGFDNPLNPLNYYAILNATQAQTTSYNSYSFIPTTASNSAVKPVDLLALDTKIDDGIANTGNVISGGVGSYGGQMEGGISASPAAGICSAGSAYSLNHSGYECTPLIRIGGSVNDPQ